MIIDHPTAGEEAGLRRLWVQAFGDPEEFLDLFFDTAYDPDRCLRQLEGETVTAALYWLDCRCRGRKVAYVYAVATAESHRGRGLCRGLLAELHGLLKDQGYAGAVLVPGEPELFRFYEKLGYRVCCAVAEIACEAGEIPLPLTPLDAQAYGRARRQLLPADALLQEGENLRFLQALGRFYQGPGCLLWAAEDPEGGFAGEFLGDRTLAPGAVAALGGKQGSFRTPGGDRAFAMYHSFDGSSGPTYLGFAFD